MARAFRPVLGLSMLALAALAGCPDEDAKQGVPLGATSEPLEVPDRVNAAATAVVVRLRGGNHPTSPDVHRDLGRLFMNQVSVVDGLMRGARTPDPALDGDPATQLGASAADQLQALLSRVLVKDAGLFAEGEAVDACGNPMLAAFVTPDVVEDLWPAESPMRLDTVLSDDMRRYAAGDAEAQAGIWDINLTPVRFDGMVDVFMQVYPRVSVDPARPGFLSHLMAFFLTDAVDPGTWQVPLFASAERVQIGLQGLLQRWGSRYTDRHYGDTREVLVFPHRARTLSTKDVSVTLLGDDLCDLHHGQRFDGELPFGCNLDDGRDLPVMLDLGAKLGRTIYDQLTGGGARTTLLDDMQSLLSYQVSAYLACPTFEAPLYIAEPAVELFTCPGYDAVEDCIADNDMWLAGCDYRDDDAFTATEVLTAPVAGGVGGAGPVLAPSDFPYVLQFDDTVVGGGQGGPAGAAASGMKVRVAATAGASVILATDAFSRLTFRDAQGQVVRPVASANPRCGAESLYTWTFASGGDHTIEATGSSDLRLLLTTPDQHLP